MENAENNRPNQTEYIKQLEENCRTQKAEIDAQKAQINSLESKLNWMLEQMRLSKHKQFGASSEKSEY
jgi:predicted RNase H-like nuclease (RuvC/YqgF family)